MEYCRNEKIKKTDMGRVCSMYRERRDVYRVLVRKSARKRPL